MDKMNCFGDEKEKVDDDSRDNTMFRNMKIPDTLEFTESFDTSKTDAISSMFQDIRVPTPEEIGIPLKEILRETQDGLMHYEGELGVFDYNPEEFEVIYIDGGDALHYIGYHAVRLPEGCINTRYMFAQDYLPEGFLGWWFDTSSVVNMEHMFDSCHFYEGFTLREKFDTGKVTNMSHMFNACVFPEGFTLGDHFDTSAVENMEYMFAHCQLPKGFTLGEKFDTGKVTNMAHMFDSCAFSEGFSLGDRFDTSKVIDMSYMFDYCKFPVGFSLGKKFDTSSAKNMECMFIRSELPKGFTFGNKFKINVGAYGTIFLYCSYCGRNICSVTGTFSCPDIVKIINRKNGGITSFLGLR